MARAFTSRRRERGSALIEAAFVTPVFLLILFAILEFGVLARNNLTTTNASRDASRSASVYGNDPTADYFILQAVEQGIAAMGADSIDFVVIYRLNAIGDPMNPSCLTTSVAAPALPTPMPTDPLQQPCNRYTADDILNKPLLEADGVTPTAHWGCGLLSLDQAWCPDRREVSLSAGPDLIGVFVRTNHQFVTGFFGTSRTIEEFTVIRIEPEEA